MKKTSVYLTDREESELERLSRGEGKSRAEVIRAAIALYAAHTPDRDFRFLGIGEGDGKPIADIPEAELMRGFGE